MRRDHETAAKGGVPPQTATAGAHEGSGGRSARWFADRSKDVIKTGGRAVYDAEPAVAEVVVVGLRHERWSEAITAVVVPIPGEKVDPDALRERLKKRLDGYKVPKR